MIFFGNRGQWKVRGILFGYNRDNVFVKEHETIKDKRSTVTIGEMLLVRNMQQCKITNLHNKKTKEGTKYACNILKNFCAARGEVGGQIESSDEEELGELLCDFYANVRSKDGEIYKKSSLYVIKFSFFLRETIDIIKQIEHSPLGTTKK